MATLYIVATPIGNLEDITLHALRILKKVDFILAEDTRQTLKLLNHYEIKKPLISYFQHSKLNKVEYILNLLGRGKNLALVTDAGTPGINDPGGKLIAETVKKFGDIVSITPIPGPNAAITVLSASGFNVDRFLFLGYPPHKKGRQKFFTEISKSRYPVVFYESVHRIIRTLKELEKMFSSFAPTPPKQLRLRRPGKASEDASERKIVVARELTKKFETVYRGTIEEILPRLSEETMGEFVIVVNVPQ